MQVFREDGPNAPPDLPDRGETMTFQLGGVENDLEFFLEIANAVQVGMYVWHLEDPADPAGMRFLYANPASVTVTGIPTEDIVGKTLREVFPPLEFTGLPGIYAEVALGGDGRVIPDHVYGDDRIKETVFSVRVFPLPRQRVGITFTDVTMQRRAEARVLETLESMGDAFYTLDREWRFTYLNPRCEEFLHQSREELLGRNVWEAFPKAAASAFYEAYHRAVREQITVEIEEISPTTGGWISLRAHPTPDGLAVYFTDVTARRQLEAQFLQAQKLEAVGQLAAGIAHDFNNLLTVIEGYATLAESRLDSHPHFIPRALKEIQGASERAASLTAKLLAFSRKQTLQLTLTDPNTVVSSALDLIEPLIGENITVHRSLQPDVGTIFVDLAAIEQVVVNLGVNARDAMPDGGNLYVTTQSVDLPSESIPELDAGSYVLLTVRDDGCGMDEHTRRFAFDPFFTTKAVGEGTGLGLSMAYGTVNQSGGHIELSSEPGAGTTFQIYLPHSDLRVALPQEGQLPGLRTGGAERILVVEDEELVRNLVAMILESNGYQVVQARDPREALLLCADDRFDLLLTDIVMPGGDGASLARAVVALNPKTRVLYTSGYAPDSIDRLEIEGSETAFLGKPYPADELARVVRKLLDLQRVV
jgi:PAS domain S-box-containing protein